MAGIIIDIGTGDGKFTYQLAKENPDKLIIGIDPSHKDLEKVSLKVDKKPQRGGLKNAFFVISDVNHLPEELNGTANQVFINFPWASLLEGIVSTRKETLASIKRICQKNAIVDIIFGYHKDSEGKKVDLPQLTDNFIESELVPKFEKQGFESENSQWITKEEINQIPSSWAKRLTFGKDRKFCYLRFKAV